jgi:hypothetical protein
VLGSRLEFLVDSLETVDLAVQSLDVLSTELQLYLKILHFGDMCITFGSVLGLELLLWAD